MKTIAMDSKFCNVRGCMSGILKKLLSVADFRENFPKILRKAFL